MSHTAFRRSAFVLTTALLAALLLAFALILSGPPLARAQDPAGAITGLTDALPLASECFVEYTGTSLTDFESADHTAVQQAINVASPGTTIRIAGTCAGTSLHLGTNQTVYISKSLTLEGGYDESNWAAGSNPVANPTTLDATNSGRVVYVSDQALSVTLSGLIMQNGITSDMGGGVYNEGGLTVLNSTVMDSSTDDGGGGIYGTEQGTILIDNSTISGNSAEFTGGGIHSEGTLTVTNSSVISDNVAGTSVGFGGGIYGAGPTTISDSELISNTAKGGSGAEGGGLLASDGETRLIRTIVYSNTAGSGGGIGSTNGAPVLLDHSRVLSNTAVDGNGGGLHAYDLAQVTVQHSRVQGNQASNSGGGLAIDGDAVLTVSQSVVISNTAKAGEGGGVYNDQQTVNVAHSTISGNSANSGGGLASSGGTLTVTQSTILDNTARDNFGGGIRAQNVARVTVQDTQIEGNQALQSGGGIHVYGGTRLDLQRSSVVSNTARTTRGGGVYVRQNSRANIENTTISGNRSEGLNGTQNDQGNGGGIYVGGSIEIPNTITVTHSTIVDNYAAGQGGGMDFNRGEPGDVLTFRNTILAGNQAGISHPDCYDYDSGNYTFNSNAHNLFSGAAGDDCPVGGSDLALSTSGQDIDDVLAPLAKNGGPTLNHALPPGSLAINAGHYDWSVDAQGNPLTTDQRGPGFPRIRLGRVDIGAYEYDDCALPADVGDEDELNDAILCYNDQSESGTYTITLDADIDLTASPWPIKNATEGVTLFLDGAGHTVDGQDTMGIQPFAIRLSTTVHIDDITITGGYESYDTTLEFLGGGLNNGGNLTLNNSRVTGNRGFRGGGIANLNTGNLAIVDSQITDNRASLDGGGVYNFEGIVTMTGSTIYSNTAAASGGGIYAWGYASLTLARSAVVSNTARTERGGGVYIGHGTRATIENSTLSGNRSQGMDGTQNDRGNGGGIYVGLASPNHLTVTHSTIIDNYAAGEGGGMDFNRGAPGDVLTLRGTILAGNQAGGAHQDCYDYDTGNYTFNTNAYNLFSGATGDDCPVGASDLSLVALGLTIGDVLELDLADNGGKTPNHALFLGSVAQDAVPGASCTLPDDQRGVDRPQGDACDIGAYELDYYALTVVTAGSGSGTVTSDLSGIDCTPGGGDCSADYADGTQVTLTATRAAGSTFAGWSGACSGDAACTITMDQARQVTATFDSKRSTVYLPYATK